MEAQPTKIRLRRSADVSASADEARASDEPLDLATPPFVGLAQAGVAPSKWFLVLALVSVAMFAAVLALQAMELSFYGDAMLPR